ncbi:MAG: protein-methionine-sulfoxide reductase catalytic subunit MsrP [Pelolinea sp.]|nr:protein-methionine-sulfoxide reductase catalytic subunit MsrP [Pelolinea sp.]
MKNAIPASEITPEELYLSRRRFIKNALTISAASLLATSCKPSLKTLLPTATPNLTPPVANYGKDELGNNLTSYEEITGYTNYYEFSTDKSGPTELARNFITSPWSVRVDGYVNKPQTFDIDKLRSMFEREERIYRLRCVEAWSMVIPWIGFPLNKLLEMVEPTSDAKYVRFETLLDPQQMPGQKSPVFPWPYIEGLRLDEAMHDLTLLATGLYGKFLTPQNGAPIRLVVPWKYGFKSIKSIVRIDLVSEMPTSLWMASSPNEYGFYAIVNPEVSHPRWSQATERRIGQNGRIDTLMFNGYGDEVAYLYKGMDLSINF